MERLTIPDERIDEHTTRRKFIDMEAVREHAMEFYWRLKAYEDTGLMPEEIRSMQEEHFSGLEMEKLHSALMELKKYQEADKDGRLVVLPCKLGDTVWFKTYTDNGKTCIGVQPHKVVSTRVLVMAAGKIFPVELPLSRLGEHWFLTREEAEKVLEGIK